MDKKIDKGVKIVLDTIKKSKAVLAGNKRKSPDRRRKKFVVDRSVLNCRYLKLVDAVNNLGYCGLHKGSIILPGVCLRCSDYIFITDRREGKDRRE
jgi:hypothetical protein